jgi:Mg2+ and Co2+ transporter CorA
VSNQLSPLSGFLGSNNLTNQLKQSMQIINSKVNENKIKQDEDLEDFILRNSKDLVESGIDAINEIKQTVLLNPQSDEVEALAEIFKGVSSAINILKDMQIAKMKVNSSKEIKEMDIQSKKEIENSDNSFKGLRMTRDEVFNFLKNNDDIVDAEFFSLSSLE